MKILIAGDGDTARHLAWQLSTENQDVVMISTDRERLSDIDARYNIMTYVGNPVSPHALVKAGVGDCDIFIAVSANEQANIISSQLAKSLGAARTVARIDNAEYVMAANKKRFEATGVDMMVFPELLAAGSIRQSLMCTWVRDWFELHDGALIVAGVRLDSGFGGHGMLLRDFARRAAGMHVCAVRRGDSTIIPNGDDALMKGDVAYFSILSGDDSRLRDICGKSASKVSRVMISGGGKMARHVARALGDGFEVTVIESDKALCRSVALEAPGVTVVNADQRDIEVLNEEGIDKMDAFVALNDSSEQNIVACMLARQAGVPHEIADIEDIQYFVEAEALNIDKVVNKKLITSSNIFQILLDKVLTTPKCLALEDAEVLEIVVGSGSTLTKAPVKSLALPRGMTIAGLVRDGRGMIVNGDTHIYPGDHVVVFCLSGALDKITKLFGR